MKKMIAGIMAVLLTFTLAACADTEQPETDNSDLQAQIDSLTAENEELKAKISELEEQLQAATPAEPENSSENGSDSDEATEITLGTAYTIDELCEFTVTAANLSKEVLPPNAEGFYTYYAEQDGSTYIDIAISIKNLRSTARIADEFGTVTAICGGTYEYIAFSTIEESNGSNFTYTNITSIDPLATGVIHYIASIPNEVTDDAAMSIAAKITILDNDYILTVR